MARALAVPVRQALWRRWQRGQSAAAMAAALGLSPRTVRHHLQRFRCDPDGVHGLAPAYARCGRRRRWPNQLLWQHALDLRRQHPSWGAGLIRVYLRQRWRRQAVPCERTLQRWFRRAGLGPAPRGRRPMGSRQRATQPHEVWQMDAVDRLRLHSGASACWLRITDEFTGAILHTKVFAVNHWSRVAAVQVQRELRQAFARWGRPRRMRVDNGVPWGSASGLPTPLALWVLGLRVDLIWNHPRCPRENAVVERTQGISERWSEPHTCGSARELQARLDELDRVQREQYPRRDGRSRMRMFPHLAHSGRAYHPRWEAQHWSLKRIWDCLSEYAAARVVDRSGDVWLYGLKHWVGTAFIGQQVYVTLDAATRQWVIQDARGQELRRQPARELTKTQIQSLKVGRPYVERKRGKTNRRMPRQNYVSHLTAKLCVG